jgi:hypothetical protein
MAETKNAKPLTRQQTVDRYAELYYKVRAWKPDVNPHLEEFNKLKATILDWYKDGEAERGYLAQGAIYSVPVSQRENKRSVINAAGLLKRIGLKRLAEIWEPTLGLISKEVPKEKVGEYVKCERTGPRTLGEPVAKEAKAA